VDDGTISRCDYPVFPPDAATDELLASLRTQRDGRALSVVKHPSLRGIAAGTNR